MLKRLTRKDKEEQLKYLMLKQKQGYNKTLEIEALKIELNVKNKAYSKRKNETKIFKKEIELLRKISKLEIIIKNLYPLKNGNLNRDLKYFKNQLEQIRLKKESLK